MACIILTPSICPKTTEALHSREQIINRKKLQSSWLILAVAWLAGFAMYAPILCIPPIQHIIKEELLITNAQLGLIFSIPVGILAVFAMPSGFLADKIGIKKAGGIGISIMAVGCVLRGTSTNFTSLLVFTCLYGIGLVLIFPNLPKLVALWFRHENVGLATGIYSTGIAFGGSLAIAISLPVVYSVTGTFQGVFFIWSIPVILAAISWWSIVSKSPHSGVESQQISRGDRLSYLILKNRSLWLIAVLLFCNNIHFYTWSGWAPALMMLKGASPDLAAFIASTMSWITIPVIFLMPWGSHRVGLRKPFFWVSAIILALASLGAIYSSVQLGWLLMVAVGITVGGTFSMILALPVELVPEESAGAASGMVLSIGYMGGLVGPWLAGYIFDVSGTLNLALVVLIGVAIAWACLAFLIPETGYRARVGH